MMVIKVMTDMLLAFIPSTGKYKVLYYFPGNANGCMILTLGSNTWNQIDQPSDSANLTFLIDHCHLSINGIVHWKIIFFNMNGTSFILSTDANSEKFHLTNLPEKIPSTYSRPKNNPLASHLVETGGNLAFFSLTGGSERCPELMYIWILEDLYNGIWRRHQKIDLFLLRQTKLIREVMRPVTSLQGGRVIFSEFRDTCIRFIVVNIKSIEYSYLSFSFMNVMKNVRNGRSMPHVMT
ncbi:hypothetical protein NE237_023058 [Protea cynaroides]|uniref:F-box associated beta-propeller type 3 domain-containing protein n=1 Tax=Protea cynaroides TaxID=273540 RepID=A0A9Q0HC76_9MAGN|nr:hypothetical protein NE237_023058 [Protea cynaroides]